LSFEFIFGGPLLIKMLFADFLRSFKSVAAMVHLLSLFFAFVGLSMVAQAAKDCDGTLRFDVLNTIDDREIFSHRPTDSLEDCVKTCYSKILFIPSKTGKHQCLLSYHAAYMCSKRKLISEYPPVQQPTLVECIRCVGSAETKGKEAKKTETAETTATTTAEEQETTVAEELETTTTEKSTMTTAQETETAATTAELETETVEESEITTTKESEIITTKESKITPELETTAVDELETIVTQDANFSTTLEITTEESEEESGEMIRETEKSDENQENNNNTVVDEIVESSAESEAKSEETTIEEFTPETVLEGSAEGTTEDLIGGSGMKIDEDERANNTTDDHTLKEIMESEIAFVTEEFEYEEFKEPVKGKETSSALGSDELEVDELLRTTVQQISKKPTDQDYTNSEDVDEIFTDNSTTTIASLNKESLRKKEDRDFVDSIERAMAFEHDASPETVQTAASNGADESGDAGQNEQKEVQVIDNEDDDDDDDHENEEPNNEQLSSLTFHDKKTNFDLKSNFEQQTAVQNQPKALCTDGLSFQTKLASSHSGIVYSQEASANSTQDCVEICHARRCSSGVFLKPVLSGEAGSCLMAFGGETCDEDLERVNRYDGPSPVEIHCIRCGSYSLDSKPQISKIAEKTISSEIKDLAKEDKQITTAPDVKTKLQSKAQQSCAGRITFEVAEPNRHRKGDFVTHELARSVADCARICFERGCTVAGFSQASVETDPSFCLLSFKTDTCSGLSRVDQLKSAEHSVQIQCIRCETASTSAEKSDKQPETAAVTESAKIVTECEGGNCIPASTKSSEKTMNSELLKEERSTVPEKEKCSNDLSFQVFQPGERQTEFVSCPKMPAIVYPMLNTLSSTAASLQCTFNVKNYVPVKQDDAAWDTFFDDFEMQVDAKNIHECAEKCASRRCTLAVYSGQTKHGNCLMTIKANRSCGAEKSHEIVDTSGKLPVLIDCVQCAA
ncbi:hypothetical protein T10_6948, partial [Trichinella papuae]